MSDLIEVRLQMKLRQLFAKNVVLRRENKKKTMEFCRSLITFPGFNIMIVTVLLGCV